MNKHFLIILTGKTASGKDTVMLRLLAKVPALKRVVTTTSRPPRPGEQNVIDYHFISEAEFKQKIQAGDFIEYVSYGGNLYGTEKAALNPQSNLIWRIDPSRAGKVKELIKETFNPLVIYLTVADEVVLKRLQDRGLSPAEIQIRMQEDAKFWQEYQQAYDFIVENTPGQLEQTISKILKILNNRLFKNQ